METPLPIPNRGSLRQKKHRRRQSLPGPNHVRIKPASQEVLSSLIDNLQNLSAHDRIDARQSALESKRLSKRSSKGPAFGAYNHETDETHEASHLHPLDAAIPPVVRPSRRTTPSPRPLPNAFRGYVDADLRPASSGSQGMSREENGRLAREESALLEPRYRTSDRSPPRLGREQGSKRTSLAWWASREHETERRSGQCSPSPPNSLNNRSGEAARQGKQHTSDAGDRSSISFLDDSSPELKPTIVNIPSRRSSKRISSERGALSIAKQPSLGSVGDGKKIPSRNSSIRHSMGAAPSPRIQRTSRYSDMDIPKEQDDTVLEPKSQNITMEEDISTESDTVKRIEELKARRASWNQNLQVHKSPTEMQAFLDKPSIPIMSGKEALTRSVSTPIVTIISKEVDPKDDHAPAPQRRKSHLLRNSSLLLRAQSDTVIPTSTSTSTTASKPAKSGSRKAGSKSKRFSSATAHPLPGAVDFSILGIYDKDIFDAKTPARPPTADSIDVEVSEFLAAPRLSQKITDPYTGRVVAFSEVGDPDGSAVFCCVGMGLTRYLTAFYDDLARTLKLRLITPDRPGVGESNAYVDGSDTPLGWPDDVLAICQHLKITRFSLLAHSAGAIYALATALRMPHYIRGRVHLLAPWIPPSQMSAIGTSTAPLPGNALPYSQRLLRSLPTTFLKAANSKFLNTSSASITVNLSAAPRKAKRKSLLVTPESSPAGDGSGGGDADVRHTPTKTPTKASTTTKSRRESGSTHLHLRSAGEYIPTSPLSPPLSPPPSTPNAKLRATEYESRLTHAIWAAATTDANPAVDLLVCLERRQPIGFRYVDINKAVVIHHGTRDSRVPIDNVRWLGKLMRKCEVRELEGEGHGLMASAKVMGDVLVEVGQEWRDWLRVVEGRRGGKR